MERIKLIMFGFNAVFWVTGAVMLGVGIWLAVDPKAFEGWEAAENAGMDNDTLAFAVYTFITVGALIFVLGFLGLLGVWISDCSCIPLCIYILLVVLIVLTESAIVLVTAIFWIAFSDEVVAEEMLGYVKLGYFNETSDDMYSSWWNPVQQQWECCGSYSYLDYQDSNYDKNNDDNNTNIYVPYTCCKDLGDLAERSLCQQGNEEYLYTKGCYYALLEFIDLTSSLIIGLASAFAALQVFGLIFASCLIHKKNRVAVHSVKV